MIVTVANLKGGVGKTTSSVFLAHALAGATGQRCVLVDADPQGSAAEWARTAADAGRPMSVPVLAQPTTRLARMTAVAPHIVIDTPPAFTDSLEAAIAVADFVLVPTSSSALDISRIRATLEVAGRMGKPAAVLLTRTRRVRSVGSAEETLRAEGIPVLRTQIPLREALALAFGQTVRETHGYDLVVPEILAAVPDRPVERASPKHASPERASPGPQPPDALVDRLSTPRPLPHRPHVVAFPDHRARPAQPVAAFGPPADDELIQRLKRSMARLAARPISAAPLAQAVPAPTND